MKRHLNYNYILGSCILVLILLCIMSIRQPIHFQKEQTMREHVVKERLMKIRMAEENYKKIHGVYTGDFHILVKGKFLADSLQYIPFTEHKRFSLAATTMISKSGKQVPLMECSATFEDYLSGLNEGKINELTDNANNSGLFPGLKIGDITINNDNAGNW